MKPGIKAQIERILQSGGLYRTAGRAAILKVLLQADKPLSREQIALRLGKAGLNKVTIYRALESFVGAGLVHKAFLHHRTWYFELAHNCTENQCHPHFTCTNCGEMQCFTDMRLPMAKAAKKGFVINHQRVQLEGLCPACSEKKAR